MNKDSDDDKHVSSILKLLVEQIQINEKKQKEYVIESDNKGSVQTQKYEKSGPFSSSALFKQPVMYNTDNKVTPQGPQKVPHNSLPGPTQPKKLSKSQF